MSLANGNKISNKRKYSEESELPTNGNLEMFSDEENGWESASDDGEAEVPEIVRDEDDEEDDEELDESLHIFPNADYDSDSSTEEDPNRVGNIPMYWYDDLPHIGYDINGKKVLRPARGDELDKFLATMDDSEAWTSAFDKNMQMDKSLTNEELDIIRRLHAGENPDASYDPYQPTVEWFTGKGKEEIMPLSGALQPKRRFIPSKWEKQKVMKIVRAIRQGRIIPNKPKFTPNKFEPYPIWTEELSPLHLPPLPAPKPPLPTNAESYNPPEEYLPTEEERKAWDEQDPEDRERNFLPQKYPSLRLVPAYNNFIKERFNRQLDLYLAPRVQRVKLNIDPESLIPKLPTPKSLRPFPIYRSLQFRHSSRARCISVSPDGAWVVSGGEDGVVSLWEIIVGREVKRWKFDSKVGALAWCPRMDVTYFAVGIEEMIHFIIPPNVDPAVLSLTQSILAPESSAQNTRSSIKWTTSASTLWLSDKPIVTIQLPPSSGLPNNFCWHRRGDYLASVSSRGPEGGVWIHQITKRHSQAPFKKIKGSVQTVLFHPVKPHFFVATQQYVRLYNLAEQKLIKTLIPGIRWISSMDVHPSGDHLIVGGYDRKLCWFDLELSEKPYKVLRYHYRAIRALHFHPTYPLFASSSDDGSIQVFHARVYNDLMTDPLIVPLKILRGHEVVENLGVLQVRWCSSHPWLVSSGADGHVSVWCS